MSTPFPTRRKQPTGIMFTCKVCNIEQDTSEFPLDRSVKRGHTSRCKTCSKLLMRERRGSENFRDTKNATNFMKRDMIRAAKAVPCADCKESFPYFVMDLDHLPEYEKSFQLGKYLSHTLAEVEAEIAKCEAVCANCHRYRTARRSGMI